MFPEGECLEGVVVAGDGRGRTIGVPTANLRLEEGAAAPRGVFAARVELEEGRQHHAVVNVGTRPTFDGEALRVEVHVLDFDGDLYGRRLRVVLEARIREERRFDSVEELRRQIVDDIATARARWEGAQRDEARQIPGG